MATEPISKPQPERRFPITSVKPIRADLGPAGAGQLINISATGIRVKSLAPLRRDAELPVRIDIPDRLESLRCSAVVVWSNVNGAAGLKLKDLSETQQKLLRGWLADFEKGESAPPAPHERDEFAAILTQIRDARMNNADALNLIVRRVTEFTSASGVVIALGKPEHMICVASEGEGPEIGTPVPQGAGLTGECIRGKRLVLCQNAATDPRVKKDPQFASAAIFPLVVKGEIRGTLQIYSKAACAFDPKSLDGLEQLADAIVTVMHGVTPQRRTGAIPETSTPASPKAKIVTRNGTLAATDSGNWVFTVPPTNEPAGKTEAAAIVPRVHEAPAVTNAPPVVSGAATIVPIAAAITPAAAPVRVATTRPVAEVRRAPVLEMPKSEIQRSESSLGIKIVEATGADATDWEPETPSSNRWIAIAAAVVFLVGTPLGYFGWRHFQAVPVVQAAPTTAVTTSAPEPAISTPVPTVASTPSVVAKEHAPLAETKEAKSHASEATKLDTIATPIHLAEPASKPAPITLAAGHSMKSATRDEADVPSPAAPQLSGLAVPVAPSVALPAANELPKLTAQVAKTWTGGTLIRRVAPVYPAAARTQGLQGAVELRFVITRNGSIDKLRVVNGNPVLARAAMEAVQLWRYDPFKADGVPMDKEASITLNFTIPR